MTSPEIAWGLPSVAFVVGPLGSMSTPSGAPPAGPEAPSAASATTPASAAGSETASPCFTRHCAACLVGLAAPAVKRCSQCGKRAYCSAACQRADWKAPGGQGHRLWCKLPCGEEDVDWAVKPVAGKGLGLVALRDFPSDYRLLVERALVSPDEHAGARDLMPAGGSLQEKWDLNCMGTGTEGESVLGLRLARANHSCTANAVHFHDSVNAVKVLLSVRPIAAGEEVCISYMSAFAPDEGYTEAHRLATLAAKWGVACAPGCPCADEERAAHVARALALDASVMALSVSDPRTALANAEALLGLFDAHGARLGVSLLERRRTLHDAAQVAQHLRLFGKAKDFMARAYDAACALSCPSSSEARAHLADLNRLAAFA